MSEPYSNPIPNRNNCRSVIARSLYANEPSPEALLELLSSNVAFNAAARVLALDQESPVSSRLRVALSTALERVGRTQSIETQRLLVLAAYDESPDGRSRLRHFIDRSDPDSAAIAVVLLGESSNESEASYLASLLQHESPQIAAAATFTLEWNAGPQRLSALRRSSRSHSQIPANPTTTTSPQDWRGALAGLEGIAPSDNYIALVGPTAAGKTTVAPIIASRLGVQMIHLDELAQTMASASIAEIIDAGGREAFIDWSAVALLSILDGKEPVIIDVGALSILDRDIRRLITSHCSPIVQLDAKPLTTISRLSASLAENSAHEAASILRAGPSIGALLSWRRSFTYVGDVSCMSDDFDPSSLADSASQTIRSSQRSTLATTSFQDAFPPLRICRGFVLSGPKPTPLGAIASSKNLKCHAN